MACQFGGGGLGSLHPSQAARAQTCTPIGLPPSPSGCPRQQTPAPEPAVPPGSWVPAQCRKHPPGKVLSLWEMLCLNLAPRWPLPTPTKPGTPSTGLSAPEPYGLTAGEAGDAEGYWGPGSPVGRPQLTVNQAELLTPKGCPMGQSTMGPLPWAWQAGGSRATEGRHTGPNKWGRLLGVGCGGLPRGGIRVVMACCLADPKACADHICGALTLSSPGSRPRVVWGGVCPWSESGPGPRPGSP